MRKQIEMLENHAHLLAHGIDMPLEGRIRSTAGLPVRHPAVSGLS